MSARHTRNSLAPVAAQIQDVLNAVAAVAGDLTEVKEDGIRFRTETELRLDNLELAIRAKAQRWDKLRFGILMALVGTSVSTGVAFILNAVL